MVEKLPRFILLLPSKELLKPCTVFCEPTIELRLPTRLLFAPYTTLLLMAEGRDVLVETEAVGVKEVGAAMMSALTLQARKAPRKNAESLTIWKI